MIGYVSLEEAKEFLSKRYDLKEISDINLQKALYLALDKIENINVRDSGRSTEQELNFPRVNENEIPSNIKKAQILEAYSILTNEDVYNDLQKGIASKSIGDMSISYNINNLNNLRFLNLESFKIISLYERKTYGH